MIVVQVRVDDPAAYSWEQRAKLRQKLAYGVEAWLSTDDEISVDILPANEAPYDA